MATEKSREQKLRREARRQGLIATKGRNVHNAGYPVNDFPVGWMIVDAATNIAIAGHSPYEYSLSLEEAEAYING